MPHPSPKRASLYPRVHLVVGFGSALHLRSFPRATRILVLYHGVVFSNPHFLLVMLVIGRSLRLVHFAISPFSALSF